MIPKSLEATCANLRHTLVHFGANMRPCRGGGGSHVACLNFKPSRVRVYKCLLLIVRFAVTVAIWPREVVSCRDFILRAVVTFWAMSLVGIYSGRASNISLKIVPLTKKRYYHNIKQST